MIPDGSEEQDDPRQRLRELESRTDENEKRINELRGWVIALIFMLLGAAITIAAGAVFLYLRG